VASNQGSRLLALYYAALRCKREVTIGEVGEVGIFVQGNKLTPSEYGVIPTA